MISWIYYEQEHNKLSFNLKFGQNIVSRAGAWSFRVCLWRLDALPDKCHKWRLGNKNLFINLYISLIGRHQRSLTHATSMYTDRKHSYRTKTDEVYTILPTSRTIACLTISATTYEENTHAISLPGQFTFNTSNNRYVITQLVIAIWTCIDITPGYEK